MSEDLGVVCGCGCCVEVRAMLAHPHTDFDYKRACHCAGYAEHERCDCHFCTGAVRAASQMVKGEQ